MARPRVNVKKRKHKARTRWFKLERLVGDEKLFVQNVEGHDFHVREDVEGVLVVKTPRELAKYPDHLVRVREKLGKMLNDAGLDLPLLMIPDDIEFARFRKLPDHEAQELERRCEQPGYRATTTKLTEKTPTEGSA